MVNSGMVINNSRPFGARLRGRLSARLRSDKIRNLIVLFLFILACIILTIGLRTENLSLIFLISLIPFIIFIKYPEFGIGLLIAQPLQSLFFPIFPVPEGYKIFSLTIVVLVSVFLFSLIKRRFFLKNLTPGHLLLFTFGLILFLGLSFTPEDAQEYGNSKFLSFIILSVAPAVSILTIADDGKRLKRLIIFLGLALGFFFLYTSVRIFQYGTEQVLENEAFHRLGFTLNPIWFGRWAGVLFLLGFIFLPSRFSGMYRLLFFAFLLGLAFLLFLSGSRGPVFALGLTLFISFIIKKRLKPVLTLLLVVLGVFLIIVPALPSPILQRLLSLSDPTIDARFFVLSEGFSFSLKNPFLGWGTGSFSVLSPISNMFWPHNIILEILFELGIMGLMPFLGFITYSFLKGLRKIKDDFFNFAFLVFIFAFINSLVSGDLASNSPLFVFGSLLSVAKHPTLAECGMRDAERAYENTYR